MPGVSSRSMTRDCKSRTHAGKHRWSESNPGNHFQTLAAMLNTYSSPIYAGESDVGAVVLQMLSGSGAKRRLL